MKRLQPNFLGLSPKADRVRLFQSEDFEGCHGSELSNFQISQPKANPQAAQVTGTLRTLRHVRASRQIAILILDEFARNLQVR
jgi:hypothetical protein